MRIQNASLTSGTWQPLSVIDSNRTGYEENFLAGILRDTYGNVNGIGAWPQIQTYASTSAVHPAPDASATQAAATAVETNWDIVWNAYVPNAPTRSLKRYYSGTLGVHDVTTGWIDPAFSLESSLGSVNEVATSTATKALYNCKVGNKDYFVSPSAGCEGQFIIGLEGYVSPTSTGTYTKPLYRCYATHHFVSPSASCEGATTEMLLGYASS
jgi:hypothetical protein